MMKMSTRAPLPTRSRRSNQFSRIHFHSLVGGNEASNLTKDLSETIVGNRAHNEYHDFAGVFASDPELYALEKAREACSDMNNARYRRRPPGGVDIPFPLRLHMLLAKEELSHIISWQHHGRCFIVKDPKAFEKIKSFNIKFTSFQRQLNLYGFRRITTGRDRGSYYHELFLKNKEFLCQYIQRIKIKGNGVKTKLDPSTEPDFYNMAPVPIKDVAKAEEINGEQSPNDDLKISSEQQNPIYTDHPGKRQRDRFKDNPFKNGSANASTATTKCTQSAPKKNSPTPPHALVTPDGTHCRIAVLPTIKSPSTAITSWLDKASRCEGRNWFEMSSQLNVSTRKMENAFHIPREQVSQASLISKNNDSAHEEPIFSFVPPTDDMEGYMSDCSSIKSFKDLFHDSEHSEGSQDDGQEEVQMETTSSSLVKDDQDTLKTTNSDKDSNGGDDSGLLEQVRNDWIELEEASFASNISTDSCTSLSF